MSNETLMIESLELEDYKVLDLVHEAYDDLQITCLDFVRHLRPDIALNKTVTMDETGRPVEARYTLDGVLYAIRCFIIDVNDDNLITRRREEIHYVANDGEHISVPIVTKDKHFDMNIPKDRAAVVEEREKARNQILAEIKAFVLGVIGVAQPDLNNDEITLSIENFLDVTEPMQNKFLKYGLPEFRDYVNTALNTVDGHYFLDYPINAEGVTVRQYIISRLTY